MTPVHLIADDAEALAVVATPADELRAGANPHPTGALLGGSYGLSGEKRYSTGALFAD
ncbi:hypothetical protein [Streptomyces sp. NPDC093984]|uniref:hypothetical protein n=1 Tax=Streptomyces sp. NPDC093984 TaxID=3366052 RepID=UPI00382CE1CB